MNDAFRTVKIQNEGTMKDEDLPQQSADNPVSNDWWHKYVDSSQQPEQEPQEEQPKEPGLWSKVLAFRPTKLQIICVSVLTVSLVLTMVFTGMSGEISRLEAVVAEQEHFEHELEQKTAELSLSDSKIAKLNDELSAERKLVEEKKHELERRKTLLEKHKVAAETEIDHWKKPMSKVLGTVLDVYSMKLDAKDPVFGELGDVTKREGEIQARWEELADELSLYEEYREEEALLRVRLLESYVAAKQWAKILPAKIDWAASGMESQRDIILSRAYFSMAMDQLGQGNKEEGLKSLQLCKQYTAQVGGDDVRVLYTKAMMDLLDGRSMVTHDPSKAIKSYKAAIDELDKVVASVPASVMVRSEFAKACRDGAMISMEGNDAGWAELLQKKAKENAAWLVKNHPEVKLPHLMYAELDIAEAEEYVRSGRMDEVEPLLKRAEKSIQTAGGDVLLQSSVAGVRAFILWDKGYITKAKEDVLVEIKKVEKIVSKEPKSVDARYRLSSLYWERSAMHVDNENALNDARLAAEQLRGILKDGAGAREASVRRMSALVLSDLGHLAVESGDKGEAKKSFDEAMRQWKHLRSHWGDCAEYRDGERWCAHKIKEL